MSNEQKPVSILMVNYNYGNFITQAVQSIVEQTYNPLEIIIVDDGSNDGSVETIKLLKQKHKDRFTKFKTLFLKENSGINSALNQGISLVNGEATIILDADDMLSPDYIEKTTNPLFKRNPKKLGFVYSDCTLINDKGREIGKGKSHKFNKELLLKKSYIPGCAATLTPALKLAFPLDERIKTATKWHRWKAIVSHGFTGKYFNERLFFYRMHENNVSGIGEKVLEDLNQEEPATHILSGYWKTE